MGKGIARQNSLNCAHQHTLMQVNYLSKVSLGGTVLIEAEVRRQLYVCTA